MKKFFLLLFSAFTLAAAVHAQDSTTAHRHHGASAIRHQHKDVMRQLGLTDEQKASMQELREEQKVKMDSVRNSSMANEEKAAQLKTIRESGRKNMEAILTPEQKSKIEELRSGQMEKRKARRQSTDTAR